MTATPANHAAEAKLFGTGHHQLTALWRVPFTAAPAPAFLTCALSLLQGILPLLRLITAAGFIDAALSALARHTPAVAAWPWLIAVAGVEGLHWIGEQLLKFAIQRLQLQSLIQIRQAVLDKQSRLAYKHLEQAADWDLIARVAKEPEVRVTKGLTALTGLISMIVQTIGVLVILTTHVWWAAAIIISFSLPLFFLAWKAGQVNYDANRETTRSQRFADTLSQVLIHRDYLDERALFRYSDAVNERWTEEFEKARRIRFRISRRWFVRMKSGSMLMTLISILTVIVLLPAVIERHLTPGLFLSIVNGVFALVQQMSWDLTQQMSQIAEIREFYRDLAAFAGLSEQAGGADLPAETQPAFKSLEFRDVSFTYPGGHQPVFKGLSLRLDRGCHEALVGANGCGKTTLVKLILGLYDQYEGQILLNGRDIREIPESERKALVSVVFQDFAHYPLTLRENICIGDIRLSESQTPETAANDSQDAAIEQRFEEAAETAGLQQVAARLPQGWDTQLGKVHENSSDLSGGEWQRVAMARALMRQAPFLILDEPTAALDPVSESQLYEEFGRISNHRTTLFISHRLGSTALADRIHVIADGKVQESGTHAELMAAQGIYASMYAAQRSWYQ